MNAPAPRLRFPTTAAALLLTLVSFHAGAGGPLALDDNSEEILWSTAQPIAYRTDGGNLSSQVTGAQARARVTSLFNAWQNIPSAAIAYTRAGQIQAVPGFSDGDVSTAAEYNAVEGDCQAGDQSPIVFDVDGSMFEDLVNDPLVIGFAGPCASDGAGNIVSGQAVMNGIFQDGIDNPNNGELTEDEYDAAFIHEFGHFSGLDHSQINVQCYAGPCGADNLAGLPTMFPILISDAQRTLSIDDIAWISKLYPAAGAGGFNATHGTIAGRVLFSDGESHVQLANVIARRVDTGGNEDRRLAASAVSGFRFLLCFPNPITDPPEGACPTGGSNDASEMGSFEIPVPAGDYTLEVENLHPDFTEGSSVGPEPAAFRVPLPVAPPPPVGPISVVAGQTSSADVILLGTPPRFDQFEGP